MGSHDCGSGSEPLLSQELAGKIRATTVESAVVIPGKKTALLTNQIAIGLWSKFSTLTISYQTPILPIRALHN